MTYLNENESTSVASGDRPTCWRRVVRAGWNSLAGIALLVCGSAAHAQGAFPSRPVKLIASFPPGQATDIAARLVATELAARWKQPVVVENQAGGLGVPAMQSLRNAPPDGYTLGVGTTGTMATNTYLLSKLPYSPLQDFAVVAPLFTTPLVFVASPAAPFRTLAELLAQARQRPDSISWAIPGSGSAQHVAGERVFQSAGVSLSRIPYKGSGQAVQDLIGGQVMFMTDSLSAAAPLAQAGRVVALAVTSSQRVTELPDVPTVAEQGFPGFSAFGWGGIIAPAGVPEAVRKKISDDIASVLREPKVAAAFRERAMEPDLRAPAEWTSFVREQIEVIDKTLRTAGVPRQ